MDANSRLMLLPVEAHKRFSSLADENRQLKYQIDAQKVIISDLTLPISNADEIKKSIQTVTDQLAAVDKSIKDASELLLEQLSQSESPPPPSGELLKLLLSKFQSRVQDLSLQGVSQGSMAISIIRIIELEEQIRQIIEELYKKGMYPETAEETQARLAEFANHTTGVLNFVQEYLQTHKKE
jgi:hypothetical protein